jgi:hypothetical protein
VPSAFTKERDGDGEWGCGGSSCRAFGPLHMLSLYSEWDRTHWRVLCTQGTGSEFYIHFVCVCVCVCVCVARI